MTLKNLKKSLAAICFIVTLSVGQAALSIPAFAADIDPAKAAMPAYVHSYSGKPAMAPDPYLVEKIGTGESIGCGAFINPSDIFLDDAGNLYVADTDNNRIVVLSPELEFIRQYEGTVDESGKLHKFNKPSGVFVTAEGVIYVADTENSTIVKMDSGGGVIDFIDEPSGAVLPENFKYFPTRLVVDEAGGIHAISRFVNQGIIEFSPEGEFEGFLAAGKVNANAAEILWKKISTAEQRNRMADFVPVDYNNLAIDEKGFLYATLATIDKNLVYSQITGRKGTEQGALVRRLNMMGQDILRRKGYLPPVGDVDIMDSALEQFAGFKGISGITGVACGENGIYSIIDNNRKHIFTYDVDGNLLFAFGGADVSSGGFRTLMSVVQSKDKMYVLDNGTCAITAFRLTDYGQAVFEAIGAYENGEYGKSEEMWKEVLKSNANMDLAYAGIGKALFRDGDYKAAMEYFKLSHNKDWYSRAFKEYRKIVIAAWLPWVVLLIIAAAVAAAAASYFKKAAKGRDRRYGS